MNDEPTIFEVSELTEEDLRPFWNGENWQLFFLATLDIRAKLGVSQGVAERTLRSLCASGDVRAIQGDYEDEPHRIKPSEWGEPDMDDWVHVSVDDLEFWLAQQEGVDQQAPPAKRAQSQRAHAKRAIMSLWPKGIPTALNNAQIVSEVGNWLDRDCKDQNVPKLNISPDTILRAAGRKQ